MRPKNPKKSNLSDLAKKIAKEIEATASKHDRCGTFPHEHYAFMRTHGYLWASVPTEYGGPGHGLSDLTLAQYEIGRGDGSTAVSVAMHHIVVGAESEAHNWPAGLRNRIFSEIATNGALINSIASEPDLGSPRGGGRPATTLVPTGDGKWLLNGRKTWSTLAPGLTYAIILAAVEDGSGDTARVVKRMDSEGISIEETWDSMSMRASGSHDIILHDVLVKQEDFIMRIKSSTPSKDNFAGAAWFPLLLSSSNVGIASAARDYAVDFAITRKPTGAAVPISKIPHIREQIARMESILLGARRTIFSCAEDWGKYPNERKDLLPELSITKVRSIEAAIQITDLAMRIVGGVGLQRNRPLERYFRDVRSGIANPPIEARALEQLASHILDREM